MNRISIAALLALTGLFACGGNDNTDSSSEVVKAPSGLMAAPLDGGAHLTWKDNSDNEAEFMIERKTESTDWKTVGTVPFNSTQYHDADLDPSMTYMYRIMAMPKHGDKASFSNEATCPGMGGGHMAGSGGH